jgi:hypothetical protein
MNEFATIKDASGPLTVNRDGPGTSVSKSLRQRFGGAHAGYVLIKRYLDDEDIRRAFPLDVRQPAKYRTKALFRLDYLPSWDALSAARDSINDAARGQAEPGDAEVIIALMIDANPIAQRADYSATIDALCDILSNEEDDPDLRFSAQIIWAAARNLQTAQKFVPPAAEFIEECRRWRKIYRSAVQFIDRLIEFVENAENIAIANGDLKFDQYGPDEIPF